MNVAAAVETKVDDEQRATLDEGLDHRRSLRPAMTAHAAFAITLIAGHLASTRPSTSLPTGQNSRG